MKTTGQTTETKRAGSNSAEPSEGDTSGRGCNKCGATDKIACGYKRVLCVECGQETRATDRETTGPLKQPTQTGPAEQTRGGDSGRPVRTNPSRQGRSDIFFWRLNSRGSVPVQPPTGTPRTKTARRDRLTTPAPATTTASCSSTSTSSSVVSSSGWLHTVSIVSANPHVWTQYEAKRGKVGPSMGPSCSPTDVIEVVR